MTPVPAPSPTESHGNYELRPLVPGGRRAACVAGWAAIGQRLRERAGSGRCVIAVDCYPGVDIDLVADSLARALAPTSVARSDDALKPVDEIDRIVEPYLGGDDPIFGHMAALELDDFFDAPAQQRLSDTIGATGDGITLVVGTGAARFDHDVLVVADLPRWEAQQRQRSGRVGNLGADNAGAPQSLLYKRSYFIDWRVADRWKLHHLPAADYLLDSTIDDDPRLVDGADYRDALARTVRRPFRLVPFFDPGPWGGHWMEQVCGLPTDRPNHAWCFDCVPEENSLLHGFGELTVETPAINLVLSHPEELLGRRVVERFGAEFPIRFDLLDTMGGGNLSLQVHPTTEYIARFGMSYTQDESYYILDASEGSSVFLGIRHDTDPDEMLDALRAAQQGGPPFDADRFVNEWPVERHDHLLIPAGTVHCSGADTMVLEISATPYIFTFKLWDWGRLGLDGKPRPINVERGTDVIDWTRRTDWVAEHLIDRTSPVAEGEGWREERTGLHEAEFIDTHRHWFSVPVAHERTDSVDVLNLVQGAEVTVESPTGIFEPFVVHYAETFVVPVAAGPYTVRPSGPGEGTQCATIRARIRPTDEES